MNLKSKTIMILSVMIWFYSTIIMLIANKGFQLGMSNAWLTVSLIIAAISSVIIAAKMVNK